jgi:hypothetical protein
LRPAKNPEVTFAQNISVKGYQIPHAPTPCFYTRIKA